MNWFNNLKVAYKVLLSCLVFILLILIVSLQGIRNINTMGSAFDSFYADRFVPLRQLSHIMRNFLQIRGNMREEFIAAGKGDWAIVEESKKQSKELAEDYKKTWEEYRATYLTPEEKKLGDEWIIQVKAPAELRAKYGEALLARDFKAAEQYLSQWVEAYQLLRDTTDKLIVLQETVGLELKKEQDQSSASTRVIMMVMLVISIMVGAFITFILARSVSNPVKKGLAFAQRIAEGDLTERIDMDQKDELGQLAKALNISAESLEKFVSEVLVASQNLAQAVDQIAGGNQNLSQRTSEQASSLEEIASTIEQATAAIRQNADNSTEANKLAEATTKMAEEGNRVVVDAVSSINEINKSSKKIEEIISLINEISFQTNLLALNAAVEAARAGEQGRGFAVVAGEVRNLAQRSALAAKEIGALIKDSIEKIGVGTDLSNRSGDALREIVASMKNVARIISEIAAASHEQKQGIDQINLAVSEMDTMTQQNAALVEETASASEEMASQAKEMQAMVERFSISQTGLNDTYAKKHKEIHLSTAGTGAKKPEPAGKTVKKKEPAPGERRKEPLRKIESAGQKSIKEVLQDEGFEEF